MDQVEVEIRSLQKGITTLLEASHGHLLITQPSHFTPQKVNGFLASEPTTFPLSGVFGKNLLRRNSQITHRFKRISRISEKGIGELGAGNRE